MIKEATGLDSELIPGSNGIFEVRVDGQVVIEKTRLLGFPGEAAIVKAVTSIQ